MTQKRRVLATLRAVGGYGLTQADFLRYPTPDNGGPITRLAARVEELRDEGYTIENRGKRDGFVVYVLTAVPAPVAIAEPLPEDPQASIFDLLGEAA